MTDFLLELRSEEIPARMQAKAKDDLARLFAEEIAKAGLKAESVETFATPRRLALIARGLPDRTESVSEERKGPRASAPEQALAGFLRSTGLTREQLTERDGVLFAVIDKPGRPTADVLAVAIEAIIRAFPWPKSMRWGATSTTMEMTRWVRPLQGIVALFGRNIIRVHVADVLSGGETVGHRFHSSGLVSITEPDTYVEQLRAAHVIVHLSERRKLIEDGAAKAAAAAGLTVIPDEGLVLENAGLTEWPVPLLGRFDPAFLDVPREVIQLTMRTNQKYFACADADGRLANAFICTANIDASDGGAAVIAGNEKVLSARLSDAKFFWEQDLKTPLENQAVKLKDIVFHEKLGTVADKVERVAKLARWLVEEGIIKPSPLPEGRGDSPTGERGRVSGPQSSVTPHPLADASRLPPQGEVLVLADLAETAARLCKADLVTGMVGEFPELQGIMGGYYARAQGYSDTVADAIRDHYKPVGQGDDVPTAPVTVAVSLADKLDSILCFFVVNLKPSGSKDPFALRRSAIAIIQIIVENGLRFHIIDAFVTFYIWLQLSIRDSLKNRLSDSENEVQFYSELRSLLRYAIRQNYVLLRPALRSIATPARQKNRFEALESIMGGSRQALSTADEIMLFFADRLKVQQREAGVRHDLIDAVFALGSEDDLVRLLSRVKALQSFVGTEEGKNLLSGYKRAANILKKSAPLPEGRGDSAAAERGRVDDPQALERPHPLADASRLPLEGEVKIGLSYTPETAEQSLIDALDRAEPLAAAAIEREDFEGAMSALASLRAPIDAFFETVTVNDPDADKRDARLALLARVRDAVHRVADFSKIDG
jgi:glycyl-tRNA synthetase beta chain